MAYDLVARLKELLGNTVLDDDCALRYSYVRGYESLYYRKNSMSAPVTVEGFIHPNGKCEYVAGIACRWCGERAPQSEGQEEHHGFSG